MKSIYFTLIFALLVSCNKNIETQEIQQPKIEVKNCVTKIGEEYFDYDNLTHYYSKISHDELFDIAEKENLNEKEKFINDFILSNFPKKVTQTEFLSKITNYGFVKSKKVIDLDTLNEVFRYKEFDLKQIEEMACVAEYRDLLIFKKKKKIVGIAKICFECNQSQILGTEINTDYFGQCGDFTKLENLIKE